MEIVKQIRVLTNESHCLVNDSNSFHVNIPCFSLPREEKPIYVQVDNLWLPKKMRNVRFNVFFGQNGKYRGSSKQLKEFNLYYYSFEDLVYQLNLVIWKDFLHGNKQKLDKADKAEKADKADKDDKDESTGLDLSDTDLKAIIKKLSGKEVPSLENCPEYFNLKYEKNRFVLSLGRGFTFVASCNLGKLLGFNNEMSNKCSDEFVISSGLVIGECREFLEQKDKICHLLIKNIIDPLYRSNGVNYSIVCSFDVVNFKMNPFLKRLSCRYLNSVEFKLLNDKMEKYDFGSSDLHGIRFTLNLLKSL